MAAARLPACSAISERVRAHRRLAVTLQRAAGLSLIGFGLRLGVQ